MRVVSDTSPLCYLLLIEEITVLPALFERVLVPRAVAAELSHPGADSRTVRADLVILDERKARRAAEERGLAVTGLLGVLADAAAKGILVNPADVLTRLRRTNFRADPKLFRLLLDKP